MQIGSLGRHILFLVTLVFLAAGFPYSLFAGETSQADSGKSLKDIILALDEEFFDAFNGCDLDSWKLFLADDIEFYQDNDNVTVSRQELEPSFMDRCDGIGQAALQRELILDSVEVHPIQGYGAVQFGTHRFWIMSDDKRHKLASTPRFVHLWRNEDGTWQITRVISYGH